MPNTISRLGVRPFQPGIEARPTWIDSVTLAVTTAVQYTLPATAGWVHLVSEGGSFYVAFGTNPTASIPGSAVTDGTASMLVSNPAARWVNVGGVAKLSFISRTAGNISLEIYVS